jgi:hypothetical protein
MLIEEGSSGHGCDVVGVRDRSHRRTVERTQRVEAHDAICEVRGAGYESGAAEWTFAQPARRRATKLARDED